MAKTSIKKLAQVRVKTAVDNGKLIKPEACEKCGSKHDYLHGHHKDYSKPLEVIWLCPRCHAAEHAEAPSLFKERRLKLFATREEAAEAFGVSKGSFAHWENGERPIPDHAWKMLECLEETAQLQEMLKSLKGD